MNLGSSLWPALAEQISQQTRTPFRITSHTPVGGGCINAAYRISDEPRQTHYFVKLNDSKHGDMFETEALSLQALFEQGAVRVPQPVCFGQLQNQTYLVLEYLTLTGRVDFSALGQQLANLHRATAEQFGWHRNNTIGATPQQNQPCDNWLDFWREQRLQPQITLAEKNGYGAQLAPLTDKLLADFACLFSHYTPRPSMLHGDLWGGNAAALADGTPVIFDPAFYFGDRETDIAMTHLFGGFNQNFYAAYHAAWPLDSGFAVRKTLYNLYHILNHLNLFGTAYLGQAVSMSEKLLAEF